MAYLNMADVGIGLFAAKKVQVFLCLKYKSQIITMCTGIL